MISRELSPHIRKAAKQYPVISITGPRQSGKTTLAQSLFPTHTYTNLENPDTRVFAGSDPRGFLSQTPHMIIDEIQHIPNLFSYIQTIVDSDKKRQFIITGSQNFLIAEKISQSLAGRIAIFSLLPLSLSELKASKKLKTILIEQLFIGCYPRVHADRLDPAQWYDNYIQTYLERDVRQLKEIGNLSLFQKFLSLIAGRTAQILNMSSLANDVGVSVPTIQSWLSVLEASYIIFRLPPYYANINKRIIKAPKIHFYDSGLICALLNINSSKELVHHPLVGNIFESFVCSNYLKQTWNENVRRPLYYVREKTGKEIDLMFKHGNTIELIEIKYGQTYHDSFTDNLTYFGNFITTPTKKRVVYGGSSSQKRSAFELTSWRDLE